MTTLAGFGALLLGASHCASAHTVAALAQPRSGALKDPLPQSSSTANIKTFARVRSEDSLLRQVLADGYARSEAFRTLIESIERSNLLVYVIWADRMAGTGGSVQVPGAANGQRTVFILINRELPFAYVTAMIAHELQHAVENANAPEVVDRDSLLRYYQRIGTPASPRAQTFDTAAARVIQSVVLFRAASRRQHACRGFLGGCVRGWRGFAGGAERCGTLTARRRGDHVELH